MMRFTKFARVAGAAAIALAATACDDFLAVDNPTVIEASTIDPVADAPTFANSALNNFYTAADNVAVYQAWFTGEAWVGDTFPTRNDIAKRQIDFANTTLGDIWNPLARAIASGERTLQLLADATPGPSTQLNIARAAFASAYGTQYMAETFCQVVISSSLENLGSPLSPEEGSAAAVERFQQVIAAAPTATPGAEATRLLNAARVGLARALLFQGDFAGAIAAASQVPPSFEYLIPRVDDPSNRGALGNTVFSFSRDRPSLVVPPYYRALDDERIESVLGGAGFPLKTQGNDLDFYRQQKYLDYGSSMRLASGLEARYIVAEAELKQGNPASAIALTAERQAVGSSSVDGDDFATSPNAALVELLDQRARDFYLEAQHMGTWLRNPDATPYVLRAGSEYYAESESTIGTQTCIPVPSSEVQNNPNF